MKSVDWRKRDVMKEKCRVKRKGGDGNKKREKGRNRTKRRKKQGEEKN